MAILPPAEDLAAALEANRALEALNADLRARLARQEVRV
jgi:hypothetical protein